MKKDPKWLLYAICGAFFITLFVGCTQTTLDIPTSAPTKTATPESNNSGTEKPKTTDPVVTPDPVKPYYVKNSAWEDVDISTSSSSRSAADLSFDQALEIVTEYNEENNDDQLRLYTEDIPITEAPTVDVYIVNEGDYVVLAEYIELDRADFISRRADFDIDARGFGGILFVDKIPPVPIIPPDLRTREEKYSIYMINKFDKIVVYNGFKYEIHVDKIWDPLSNEIKAGYINGIDDLMDWYLKAFKTDECLMVTEDAPWRVVYGKIYVEPSE